MNQYKVVIDKNRNAVLKLKLALEKHREILKRLSDIIYTEDAKTAVTNRNQNGIKELVMAENSNIFTQKVLNAISKNLDQIEQKNQL